MDFTEFQSFDGAQTIFRRLGAAECLAEAEGWEDLRRRVVAVNADEETDGGYGSVVLKAQRAYGVASSGERVLLLAALYVCDFARQADELVDGKAWLRMSDASGDYRAAVAACIGADAWI